ncbi:MAG: hypothetical protein M1133_15320 [Armatimonadetes bacterium]|nr:hypothetical protein [Armatimonadota bacterium]
MKHDRLRNDSDEIHNLEDLIEARDEYTSHFAADRDSLEADMDISEDIDVDEALTFPHPKHKPTQDVDLMDTPHKEDMDEDWADQDIQPSDYEHAYEEAISTHATDDADEVTEEQVHEMGHMNPDEVTDEESLEVMPRKFMPGEDTGD